MNKTLFVVILRYIRPIAEIEAKIAEHNLFLEEHYNAGRFICSGRQIPREGGVILSWAQSREELEKILDGDPFRSNGLASYELTEFYPTKYSAAFEKFLQQD